jgi:hypothetical protein
MSFEDVDADLLQHSLGEADLNEALHGILEHVILEIGRCGDDLDPKNIVVVHGQRCGSARKSCRKIPIALSARH